MTHAIRFYQPGGPEVMRWELVEIGDPGPGQVLIRHSAVGLNFIDVYHRTGLYPLQLPATLGMEGAGVVEAVGAGVTLFQVGERVAYASGPVGAYAERRLMPAERLVRIPASISDEQAAAMLLQGLTAHYLLRRTYPVRAGTTMLVHAAAGGVGLLLCQWARQLGARVLGTVSSTEKADLARAHGCAEPIIYTREDFLVRVRELTHGRGVDVVYDSVGADTFARSLDCLAPLGMAVSFGQSSGPVPPLDLGMLSAKGSLFVTRPTLATYTAQRSDLEQGASELFQLVERGELRITIGQRYPLEQAAQAHRDLAARRTVGSTIFTL